MKKLICTIQSNIRYAETDQMGYVYYGNYALYCEDARLAALASLGISYHVLESQYRIGLPVIRYNIKYKRALIFGNVCETKVFVTELTSRKITFGYELFTDGRVVALADTELMFLHLDTKKFVSCPETIYEKLTKD
jgi:acyl-CoA thioester hydrolase